MRRDVYIENDSGGFSVLAADAVDAIIDDGRSDDFGFVANHKVLLLELYGDDSMPVRVVVDEPLRPDEESQWLARATWQIETSDGRMLVMGGFDPDVLSWWKDADDPNADGRGIGVFSASPGRWKVDVYAHAGSMNGRVILSETDEKPGAAFRRSHPGKAFPMWLAKMLDFSGEDDPGFEDHWKNVKASIEAGHLNVDVDGGHAIGFLVHLTRTTELAGEPPESGWFDREANSRVPAVFPLGIASEVPDLGLTYFRNQLLGIREPEPPRPIATDVVEVIEAWTGDPLKAVDGGSVPLAPNDIYLLHWMAGLTADSTPRFELWIQPKGGWTAPASTPDFAVVSKSGGVTAIGPVRNTAGWHTWWTARDVAKALTPIPDGSTIDLAMAVRLDDNDTADHPVGRALYSGTVAGGVWQISEASPKISQAMLTQAIGFTRDMVERGRLTVRAGAERAAFDASARIFSPKDGSLVWEGDQVHLAEPEERMLIILAGPVFRARFGEQWPMDANEDDDDEE